jgi:hypothetical protein
MVMRTLMAKLMAAGVVGLSLSFAAVWADEEKVSLDKVPPAVLDAVKARFAGAEMLGAEKETENGKTVYEIAVRHNKQKIEVSVSPEGKLLEMEKQIDAKDMPQAVVDTLKEKYPDASYKMVEEITKVNGTEEKVDGYEVLLVTAAKKRVEVVVSPDGKITKTEDKGEAKKGG